ncbi:MAG: ATP-binding protein [Alphaproteobacteria bacterium]
MDAALREPAWDFDRVLRSLGALFDAPLVFHSEIHGDQLRFPAVFARDGGPASIEACPVAVTPCAAVASGKALLVHDDVARRFPDAAFLAERRAIAFCGFPALAGDGSVLAVIGLIDQRPHAFSEEDRLLLGLLGRYIGATLERRALGQGRAAAEETRQTLERQMDAILSIAPEAIIVTDADGRIRVFNVGAAAIFGYAPGEVVGKRLDMLIPARLRAAHPSHFEAFRRAREASRPMGQRSGIAGLRKSGEEFPAEASIGKISADGETLFAAILRDVSERKQIEQALVEARQSAELANQAKSRFLANMSHEFRTPLNAVIGFAEMLLRELHGPLGDPRYREYAHDIYDSGRRMLDLVSNVLDMAMARAGQLRLNEETLDLAAILGDSMAQQGEAARLHDVALAAEIDKAALPGIRADRAMLARILGHLLSNAIKFTPRGGQVRLRAWANPDSGIVIQVTDTGIGIAVADIPRVLSQFEQVDAGLDRRYEGSGIGLPLAKSLVELHGGYMDIQSRVGGGTSVTVRLPAQRIVPEDGQPVKRAS